MIYQIIFGTDHGQVRCSFHNDTRASAGIGPNGEYNCFACGAKAGNTYGFVANYFNVGYKQAVAIESKLTRLQEYKYAQLQLNEEQQQYLQQLGLTADIINRFFFRSAQEKLMFRHTWNHIPIGYTWFNAPQLSSYNASQPKYYYDKNNIGGMLVPYDTVLNESKLLITEGEKDMLITRSKGIQQAVAKIGGAMTPVVAGINLNHKQIVLVYDCDEKGREGAIKDAIILTNVHHCQVKVVDLQLQNGEDLHDYFMKYHHTKEDLYALIQNTQVFTVPEDAGKTEMQHLLDRLTQTQIDELKKLIQEKENDTCNKKQD